MGYITVFTLRGCPHCRQAKDALRLRNVPFVEIDLSLYPGKLKDMLDLVRQPIVPQIFMNEEHIGGVDDLLSLLELWDINDNDMKGLEEEEKEHGGGGGSGSGSSGGAALGRYVALVGSLPNTIDPRLVPPVVARAMSMYANVPSFLGFVDRSEIAATTTEMMTMTTMMMMMDEDGLEKKGRMMSGAMGEEVAAAAALALPMAEAEAKTPSSMATAMTMTMTKMKTSATSSNATMMTMATGKMAAAATADSGDDDHDDTGAGQDSTEVGMIRRVLGSRDEDGNDKEERWTMVDEETMEMMMMMSMTKMMDDGEMDDDAIAAAYSVEAVYDSVVDFLRYEFVESDDDRGLDDDDDWEEKEEEEVAAAAAAASMKMWEGEQEVGEEEQRIAMREGDDANDDEREGKEGVGWRMESTPSPFASSHRSLDWDDDDGVDDTDTDDDDDDDERDALSPPKTTTARNTSDGDKSVHFVSKKEELAYQIAEVKKIERRNRRSRRGHESGGRGGGNRGSILRASKYSGAVASAAVAGSAEGASAGAGGVGSAARVLPFPPAESFAGAHGTGLGYPPPPPPIITTRATSNTITNSIHTPGFRGGWGGKDVSPIFMHEMLTKIIPRSDLWYHGKLYRNVFRGSDGVTALVKAFDLLSFGTGDGGRAEAAEFGLVLQKMHGLLDHVKGEHDFGDNSYFFRISPKPPHGSNPGVGVEGNAIPLDRLQHAAFQLKSSIEIKDRRYRFKVYPNCFVGREAVTFLVTRGYARNRDEAVRMGADMQSKLKLFHHVTADHAFKDEDLFYKFK